MKLQGMLLQPSVNTKPDYNLIRFLLIFLLIFSWPHGIAGQSSSSTTKQITESTSILVTSGFTDVTDIPSVSSVVTIQNTEQISPSESVLQESILQSTSTEESQMYYSSDELSSVLVESSLDEIQLSTDSYDTYTSVIPLESSDTDDDTTSTLVFESEIEVISTDLPFYESSIILQSSDTEASIVSSEVVYLSTDVELTTTIASSSSSNSQTKTNIATTTAATTAITTAATTATAITATTTSGLTVTATLSSSSMSLSVPIDSVTPSSLLSVLSTTQLTSSYLSVPFSITPSDPSQGISSTSQASMSLFITPTSKNSIADSTSTLSISSTTTATFSVENSITDLSMTPTPDITTTSKTSLSSLSTVTTVASTSSSSSDITLISSESPTIFSTVVASSTTTDIVTTTVPIGNTTTSPTSTTIFSNASALVQVTLRVATSIKLDNRTFLQTLEGRLATLYTEALAVKVAKRAVQNTVVTIFNTTRNATDNNLAIIVLYVTLNGDLISGVIAADTFNKRSFARASIILDYEVITKFRPLISSPSSNVFPFWIIGVAAGSVVLLALVAIVVYYKCYADNTNKQVEEEMQAMKKPPSDKQETAKLEETVFVVRPPPTIAGETPPPPPPSSYRPRNKIRPMPLPRRDPSMDRSDDGDSTDRRLPVRKKVVQTDSQSEDVESDDKEDRVIRRKPLNEVFARKPVVSEKPELRLSHRDMNTNSLMTPGLLPPRNNIDVSKPKRPIVDQPDGDKVFEHKTEIERWRNKQRQRDRINAILGQQEPTSNPAPPAPLPAADNVQKKSWRKAQKDIGAVLDPETAATKGKRFKNARWRQKYQIAPEPDVGATSTPFKKAEIDVTDSKAKMEANGVPGETYLPPINRETNENDEKTREQMQHLISDALKLLGPDFSDTLTRAFEAKISQEQSNNSAIKPVNDQVELLPADMQRRLHENSQQVTTAPLVNRQDSRGINTFQPIFRDSTRSTGNNQLKSNMPRTFIRPEPNQPVNTQEIIPPMVGNRIGSQQFPNQQYPPLYGYYPQNTMSMPNQPVYNPMLGHANMFGPRAPYFMGYSPQPTYPAMPMPAEGNEQMRVTPVIQQPDGMGGMTWMPDYSAMQNPSQYLPSPQANPNNPTLNPMQGPTHMPISNVPQRQASTTQAAAASVDMSLPRMQQLAVRNPASLQRMQPLSNTTDSFTSGLSSSQNAKPLIRSIKEELLRLSTRGSDIASSNIDSKTFSGNGTFTKSSNT